MPAKVSRPDDVQAFVTRSTKDKTKLSLRVLEQASEEGARVKLNLSAPLPDQAVTPYELSSKNPKAIGELPARKVGGNSIEIELPPMSVLRFDAKGG